MVRPKRSAKLSQKTHSAIRVLLPLTKEPQVFVRFGTVWVPVICDRHRMSDKRPDTLSSVKKEMTKPRLAASVRDHIAKPMAASAKFNIGVKVYNRNTKEDGFVSRVYHQADSGEIMYEVQLTAGPKALAGVHYLSDWNESNLERFDSAAPQVRLSQLEPE
jgi:hypothetical protein